MNFEPQHSSHWQQAAMPNSLKDQWGNIDSFIYVISKTFPPYENTEPLHLVKVGMSRFETANDAYKGLSRLSGLKTSLIEMQVHRIYLYDHFDTSDKSTRALQAEQKLHKAIEHEYPKVRIKFKGFSTVDELNPNTEWFAIPKKEMTAFLKWLDDQAFYAISPVAMYGTAFTPRTSKPIKIDKARAQAASLHITDVSGQTRAQKGLLTPYLSRYAKTNKQRTTEIAAKERKKNELEDLRKLRKKYEKTPEYFKKLFVGQRFTDDELDGKKYERKVITDVDYFTTPTGSPYKLMKVLYEPMARKRGEKMLTETELDEFGGLLTIPEIFTYFPKLIKKHQAVYDWYVVAERLDVEALNAQKDSQ